MYGKSNMQTYITICKIESQGEFAVWLRKLKQGLYFNLEGLDGEGDSKGRRYMYTMECYSAMKRSTFESVLMRWMNLEPIIQSEVSQKEKNKYHILMYIFGI